MWHFAPNSVHYLLYLWKKHLFFVFLEQNICCGNSKEPSQRDGSFEHPKYMFNLMCKKIITILRLFLKQNICCGYSKERSQRDSSFEHPKYMLCKKIVTILHSKSFLIWTCVFRCGILHPTVFIICLVYGKEWWRQCRMLKLLSPTF